MNPLIAPIDNLSASDGIPSTWKLPDDTGSLFISLLLPTAREI